MAIGTSRLNPTPTTAPIKVLRTRTSAAVPGLESNWYALGMSSTIDLFVLAFSPGWRVLALVLAGMNIFGVLLDAGGLFLAIAVMVIVAESHDAGRLARRLVTLADGQSHD